MISEALRGSINDKISAGIYVAIHFLVLGLIARPVDDDAKDP